MKRIERTDIKIRIYSRSVSLAGGGVPGYGTGVGQQPYPGNEDIMATLMCTSPTLRIRESF